MRVTPPPSPQPPPVLGWTTSCWSWPPPKTKKSHLKSILLMIRRTYEWLTDHLYRSGCLIGSAASSDPASDPYLEVRSWSWTEGLWPPETVPSAPHRTPETARAAAERGRRISEPPGTVSEPGWRSVSVSSIRTRRVAWRSRRVGGVAPRGASVWGAGEAPAGRRSWSSGTPLMSVWSAEHVNG